MGTVRLGLMGFGEIGRDIYQLCLDEPEIEVVAISDIGPPEILHYLLQTDGRHPVDAALDSNFLVSGPQRARVLHGVAPRDVPWDAFGVDVVIESTHKYRTRDSLSGHLESGARRVILSSTPDEELDNLVVIGVNEDAINAADCIVSAGSSTTNAAALLLKILDQAFGVDYAMLTSVHPYTSDQPLRDRVGTQFRRSRSAAVNIIPNVSQAPRWIEHLLPQLRGKIEGSALNVPVRQGSMLDLTTAIRDSGAGIEEVNAAVVRAAGAHPGVIESTDDPIVSSDVIGNTHSLVFDSQATMRTGKRLLKTICWYDYNRAQASRLLDLVKAYRRVDLRGGEA